nr:MAG TPA: hypothetical protein [Caudoviricetes sp.]
MLLLRQLAISVLLEATVITLRITDSKSPVAFSLIPPVVVFVPVNELDTEPLGVKLCVCPFSPCEWAFIVIVPDGVKVTNDYNHRG